MTDLETRLGATLRSLASSVDGFAVPPVDRVADRAARLRRGQRARLGGATLAVAAALVAGGLTLASGSDRDPAPIGGENTTSVPTTGATVPGPTSSVQPTTPGPTTPPDPTAGESAAGYQPFGPTDRIATLPEQGGWTPVAYQWGGAAEAGVTETYASQMTAAGVRTFVTVTAYATGVGDASGGPSCEERGPEQAPGANDGAVYAVRCLADQTVSIAATGLGRPAVARLAASIGAEDPTRVDVAGTDLVSLGRGPAQPPMAMISYTHPSWPGLQLTTMIDGDVDSMAFFGPGSPVRDRRDIDLDGVPAVQYVTAPGAPDRADRTALSWRPAPGVFVTLLVEDVYDQLPAIARQVVLRPAVETHRVLEDRFAPRVEAPAATTTTTSPTGSPIVGLASVGLLPAGDGWSPIEYGVTPPFASVSELYAGPVRADGSSSFVSVQVGPPDQWSGCPGDDRVTLGEMPLGTDGMLGGSRCIDGTPVSLGARGLGRAVVDRLLRSIAPGALTTIDTSGTDLVSLGVRRGVPAQVRVRYAHPDGGPGATVLTSVDDVAADALESTLAFYGPRDAERVEVAGLPAVRYRSVVEGNVAWTNVVWRPAAGVLVTVMVSGETDRIVDIARSVQLRPAAAAHADLRTLPTSVGGPAGP